MRNLANVVTLSRFAFAAVIAVAEPLSASFWAAYALGCASDVADGLMARKLGEESELGARLDSVADLLFTIAVLAAVFRSFAFGSLEIVAIALVALVRVAAYAVGYFRFRTFSALHTWGNKAAGVAVFASPAVLAILGSSLGVLAVCAIAMASALEELAIVATCDELDRDCRGINCLQGILFRRQPCRSQKKRNEISGIMKRS